MEEKMIVLLENGLVVGVTYTYKQDLVNEWQKEDLEKRRYVIVEILT